MNPLRIVLADDHKLVRAGIRTLLEKIPGVQVVGEADGGREAVALCHSEKPDLLLIDIAMGEGNGLDAAARVAQESPAVKVIILSMHADEEYVMRALRHGVAGYLLKDSAAAELDLALDAVRRGETYLSPAISRKVIDGYLGQADAASHRAGTGAESLTSRQREVLKLVAEGKSTKQIAAALNLSVKTVDTHRSQVMQRLRIHDVAGLVRYAIRLGLVPPVD